MAWNSKFYLIMVKKIGNVGKGDIKLKLKRGIKIAHNNDKLC